MSEQEKKKGMSKGLKIGLYILGGWILIAMISTALNTNKEQKTTTPTSNPASTKTKTATPAVTATPTPKFIFDVPSLFGKNIDEIRTILGEPADKELTESTQEQLSLGATQWTNTFKKDEYELQVTFNPSSRKIIDFFACPSSGYVDQNKLMEVSNTKENASNYTIKPVKELKNPNNITGITIILK